MLALSSFAASAGGSLALATPAGESAAREAPATSRTSSERAGGE
jgi:hypothetical protein